MKTCINECPQMGRREFLVKAVVLGGTTFLTLSAFGAEISDGVTIEIGPDSPLAKVGGSQVLDSPAGKLIVIRTGEAAFAAFSALCTHKRGLLAYNPEAKRLECPKHSSKFSVADGKVVGGPAEEPLPVFTTKSEAKSVTVVLTK